MQIIDKLIFIIFCALLYTAVHAQTYELTQTVVAGGGNSGATGGIYSLDSTTGQTAAGNTIRQTPYGLTVGFWNFDALSPTAASVTIGGRVTDASLKGIFNARVSLTNINGETRHATTNRFGYYRFEDVEVGETYIVEIRHKRFQFAPQIIAVTEAVENLNFVGNLW